MNLNDEFDATRYLKRLSEDLEALASIDDPIDARASAHRLDEGSRPRESKAGDLEFLALESASPGETAT
jgi:hypothetical protein